MKISIYVHWKGFGFVAQSPDTELLSQHMSGKKLAAVNLCQKVFGEKKFKITPRFKGQQGVYVAEETTQKGK